MFRLELMERHVLGAQNETLRQWDMNEPHERMLTSIYVWSIQQEVALDWAQQQGVRAFGAVLFDDFLQRMEEQRVAINRITQDSRARNHPVNSHQRHEPDEPDNAEEEEVEAMAANMPQPPAGRQQQDCRARNRPDNTRWRHEPDELAEDAEEEEAQAMAANMPQPPAGWQQQDRQRWQQDQQLAAGAGEEEAEAIMARA